jgi:hypothetical protein
LSPQFEKELNGAESQPNAVIVRAQLKRLLAHPLFSNSKRYPVLLAYAVEEALKGNASELKERTIGVEAFGREPSYDVNLDPVVRTTAAEVRKRLIQYYYNSEHADEIVIDLPVGSYIPSFREPSPPRTNHSNGHIAADKAPSSSTDALASQQPHAQTTPRAFRIWTTIALATLCAAFIGFGLGRNIPHPTTNLQRFWHPITSTSARVTFVLGEPMNYTRNFSEQDPVGNLNVSDVVTLARSLGPVISTQRPYRVAAASAVSFEQLREGPIVLIGAFDNRWTMRITETLPFRFEPGDNGVAQIVDRKNSPPKSWVNVWSVPKTQLAKDYAIVARIHDDVTGQPLILLGGLLPEGTEAAGELVSNPEYLNSLLAKLPTDWANKNIEAIIEANIIEGHPGPPTVIAVQAW